MYFYVVIQFNIGINQKFDSSLYLESTIIIISKNIKFTWYYELLTQKKLVNKLI